jgi:hypothetical protein
VMRGELFELTQTLLQNSPQAMQSVKRLLA